MKIRTLCRKLLAGLCAAAVLLPLLPQLPVLRASAAETITWDPFAGNENVPGMYCYTVSGNVTNPCETGSYSKKKDIIRELWFDFSVKSDNGTGSLHTYRLDFSYNSSAGKNNNNDLLKKLFIRNSTGAFSFDIWLPGQLTNVSFQLNVDGYLGWFSWERLSFEVNRITCGGAIVNTNPSAGNVSSSTGSSGDKVGARMLPIDGELLMNALGTEHLTLTEYQEKAESGEFTSRMIKDSYGAVIENETLLNLASLCDGEINQSFAHSDEESYYYYALDLNVYNPINVNSADSDALEVFYFDFRYKDQNGSGKEKTYRFDLSWADGKNRNDKTANRFRAINDDGFDLTLGIWVPGIVSEVSCLLNMNGGERLGVTVEAIRLGGFCVSENADYVSSAYYDSSCTIACRTPDPQIDLGTYNEEETAAVMKQLRFNQRTPLRDQYGALISDTLWNSACKEVRDYFDTFSERSTPMQLIRSPQYITRNAMSGTVYHAQLNDTVQSYMAGRKTAVENAAEIAKSVMKDAGVYTPPMPVPDKWTYSEDQPGSIVLKGLPETAVIYRKLTESESAKTPVYIHLKASELESCTLQKSGYTDEIFIDVPESCVIAGAERSPGTETLGGLTPKVMNAETGKLEDEKYYKTDANGNIILNRRGKPTVDNSKKPLSFSYQYILTFPEDGSERIYQIASPLPAGMSAGTAGSLMFRNLPDGTEGYMTVTDTVQSAAGGTVARHHVIRLTKADLETYSFTAQQMLTLYIALPEGYCFADAAGAGSASAVTFGQDTGDQWCWYSIESGQLRQSADSEGFRYAYDCSFTPPQSAARVYTAAARILSSEKKGGKLVTQYQAGKHTVLSCGYDLMMLTADEKNPPLVMTAADGKYSDLDGETDAATQVYIFFPDTYQYTVFDENESPVGFRFISDEAYKALGVDSTKYTGFSVSIGTLQKTAAGKTLTVIALDR